MSTVLAPAHIKVRYADGGLVLERCEDGECRVDGTGRTSCGRHACPSCGSSGANLIGGDEPGEPVFCRCGHSWVAAW